MIYLLDVNALVALGFMNHEFHGRIGRWIQSRSPRLATCPITELGFVRVLAQAPAYGLSVSHARTLLVRLKEMRASPLSFIPDTHDVAHLPEWAKLPKQITDGHLSKLARANAAILATLDESIADSFVIPR